jgi:large subunit ribosomal protein L23
MATDTTTTTDTAASPFGPGLAPHQVLLRPLVTEKGMHRSTRNNAYAFEVNKLANKFDVRRAVEELFNVKVEKVYIQNRKGKPRRSRFRTVQTGDWKKAIVKLGPDHRIDFF